MTSPQEELTALADDLDNFVHDLREEGSSDATALWLEKRASALRTLASQAKQEPVAWISPDGKFSVPDAMTKERFLSLFHEAEIGTPVIAVYADPPIPPPAAGWDELSAWLSEQRNYHENSIARNDPAIKAHVVKLGEWIEALRSSQYTSDAGGGVRWRPISEDTSWLDGRDVVLLANGMEVSARYCPGEWSDETPDCPREYSGAVWSCFDDQFQFEIEECSKDPSEWSHDGVTHWRPALSNPAAADSNASAEARLREALTPSGATKAAYIGEFKFPIECRDEDGEPCDREVVVPWTTTKEIMKAILDRAISPDPHASDCEKQGDTTKSEGGGQVAPAKCSATGVHPTDTSCAAEPEVAPGPSDRPADVTVTELAAFLRGRSTDYAAWPVHTARALLDAFTVGRR